MSRIISAALAASAMLLPQMASANDWYRAESEHFILYSEDSEEDTREFVQDLERLNEVLALFTSVNVAAADLPPSSKLTVFRFGEQTDMSVLAAGNRNTGVGGFFIPRVTGSVAFVPRQRNRNRSRSRARDMDDAMQLDPRGVLHHEYVHYFMWQHADAPYPLWYSEGFAELFGNLEFNDDHFVIGEVPTARSASLATVPIDIPATFDPPPGRDRYYVARTYAHGWLIASHLNLNEERRGQMGAYMAAIANGATRMEAAEQAFGDLDVLEAELEEFRRGRARILRVPYAVNADPAVEIRQLTEDEEARMELMITSKRGVDEDDAERLVIDARRLVERYPQSVPVLLAATEAEFDGRNYDEAEALADRILEIEPDHIEAAIYRGRTALRRSFENPEQIAVARQRFAAANRMENDHAFPLYGYYLTYLFDDEAGVPDAAKMALEGAFGYAAYDRGVRQALVHMLLTEGRLPEARIVGAQWTDGQGEFQCVVRAMFDEFETGDREALLEEFKPDHPGEYLDEAAREAQTEEFEAQVEAYGCTDGGSADT
ncbi:hypothetical protein [Aurantiacibacter gangjinensis]|uniref:Uncharacterized protein n=1 Tax=Aurantiacibacter gangjinensis TaxID=502682 RepID=A0A0G9MRN7_9SPHN|nr:hypothetical protein [Aurantiacibacter gangjinensis]APE29128.1 hypothetical protein BMF35_a2299 [Aurantiacibacter gangjinensis]KLE33209.1 hypothetical protein AAW01_04380 [Aurantiacibacter gangjinensis]